MYKHEQKKQVNIVNPNSMEGGGLHYNNTAVIKQISLFDTALGMPKI